MTRRFVWLVFLLAVGCAPPEPLVPSPVVDFRVEHSQHAFGTITISVIDETGLVVDAQKLESADGPPGNGVAMARPDSSSLEVTWLGGACHFGPTVTLTGNADDLLVALEPDAGDRLPPGVACTDIGLFFGVTLVLATPVLQDNVGLQVNR